MLDLTLAIAHHLLVFSLFGVLFGELVLIRKGVDLATVARVGRFDLMYGILAGLIIGVAYIRWRRSGAAPSEAQVAGVRRWLWAEMALFALLPAFAAAMARGFGEFT